MKFIHKALSNDDLINWIKYFKIEKINGVFSRNDINGVRKGFYIINLDDSMGGGHIGL